MDALAFFDVFYCSYVYLLPTKKNRKVREINRLMKSEKEFVRLKKKFGAFFMWNLNVRNFINNQPVEKIFNNGNLKTSFLQDLEKHMEKIRIV